MPLPKTINLADCVPDPYGRANHIFHPPTDEVLHVDKQTAQKVGRATDKASGVNVNVFLDGVKPADPKDAETGLTLAADEKAETGERDGEQKEGDGADRAELLTMAEALELTVPDGLSDAELLALIEAEALK